MFAYAAVAFLVRLLSILPLGAALALGRFLGTFAFKVVRLRRQVVLSNLRHVLGETRTEAELHAIAHEAYRHFAMTFVEILRSSASSGGLAEHVSIDALERFPAIRAARKPVIFLQPHAGNFDLAAYAFAARGFPHHTVMRALRNERINDLVVRTRERHGVTVHLKGADSFDELLEALRAGEWVGLLPDQNAKRRGVTVDWLGRPASIFKGPALLHLATGAQIVVAVDERLDADPRKHHTHMTFLPPHAATGDEAKDARAIMQAVADAMAAHILRKPGQYFWFHRLWGKEVAEAA